MITNNNDNIVQQWFTLKSTKKKCFNIRQWVVPPHRHPSRLQSLSHSHISSGICLFVLSARIIPSSSCRRLTFQSKWCFNSSGLHHQTNILSRWRMSSVVRILVFFSLFVIVYKYRNKINYSMLASYCCRLRVFSLPPRQILCHPHAHIHLDDGFETMPVGLR